MVFDLRYACALVLSISAAASPGPINDIKEVLRLTSSEAAAGMPVRLSGVITYLDPVTADFFIAQEDGTGISMWYPKTDLRLVQGDLVEIVGRTEAGDYAPKIALPLDELRVVSHHNALPVTLPNQSQLTANGLDCRHIETDAVVRDVIRRGEQIELRLATLLGPTRLLFASGSKVGPLDTLIGAEIKLRATVGVDINKAGQRTGLRLYAQSFEDVRVVHPGLRQERVGLRPLGELLRFTRSDQTDPRLRVEGKVIQAAEGQIYIADGDFVARLDLAESVASEPLPTLGSRIQVLGFVEPGGLVPKMVDARVLSMEKGLEVQALETDGRGLLRPALAYRLVRIQGTVSSVIHEPSLIVSLRTADGPALAMASSSEVVASSNIQEQSLVEVVGIQGRAAGQNTPVVFIRQSSDLRILNPPPFWTLARVVALAIAASLAALGMVMKWQGAARRSEKLKRLVNERTSALTLANTALEEHSRTLEAQHRELRALHDFRARFVATAAHDLRSPLTAVMNAASLLARDLGAEERRVLYREVSESVDQMNEELTELVQSYRGQENVLRREPFDVRHFVERAVRLAQPLFSRKRQELTVQMPENPSWVHGDPVIFQHVVLNVLSNASKFSSDQTQVSVTVSTTAPQVQVSDQGPGLDAENLSRLFREDLRPNTLPTASEPSSGHGLLLCDRWMRAMGGAISCESVVGKGSIFFLALPEAEDAPVVPSH